MKVHDILNTKSHTVVTVDQDATVLKAIQELADHNIGALPVCDRNGTCLGIVTERDLLRACARNLDAVKTTRVKEVMTSEVAVCLPEDDTEYAMNIMTLKKIRHLPVMEKGKLAGMISVRDLVDAHLERARADIHWLKDYMSGSL